MISENLGQESPHKYTLYGRYVMNNTADGYVIYFQRMKMKNTWLKIEYWEFPQKDTANRIDLFTCFLS